MWRPDEIPVSSTESKPELIHKIQEEGFRLQEEFEVYEEDRTRVRINFPDNAKRNANYYSGFQETPSMTVIEMVYMEEAKRLGLDYFSKNDLPLMDTWDMFTAVLDVDSPHYGQIKDYKQNAKEGSEINVPSEEVVKVSMLKKHSRKLDERVDEFPVSKRGILTTGFARLVSLNERCFLGSTKSYSNGIIEKLDSKVENAKGMRWNFCFDLGVRLGRAASDGDVYMEDFRMFMEEVRSENEKTYNKIKEGFETTMGSNGEFGGRQ